MILLIYLFTFIQCSRKFYLKKNSIINQNQQEQINIEKNRFAENLLKYQQIPIIKKSNLDLNLEIIKKIDNEMELVKNEDNEVLKNDTKQLDIIKNDTKIINETKQQELNISQLNQNKQYEQFLDKLNNSLNNSNIDQQFLNKTQQQYQQLINDSQVEGQNQAFQKYIVDFQQKIDQIFDQIQNIIGKKENIQNWEKPIIKKQKIDSIQEIIQQTISNEFYNNNDTNKNDSIKVDIIQNKQVIDMIKLNDSLIDKNDFKINKNISLQNDTFSDLVQNYQKQIEQNMKLKLSPLKIIKKNLDLNKDQKLKNKDQLLIFNDNIERVKESIKINENNTLINQQQNLNLVKIIQTQISKYKNLLLAISIANKNMNNFKYNYEDLNQFKNNIKNDLITLKHLRKAKTPQKYLALKKKPFQRKINKKLANHLSKKFKKLKKIRKQTIHQNIKALYNKQQLKNTTLEYNSFKKQIKNY